ncbi:PTS sugar transporter subunit IIC [Paenibacillus pinistramenti]|uniref:PTS sugar transporter subunit IIC n=1 Tax=Paenibacillus pinistramenti TaxID=1768003 RepID=UPI001107BE31|nr:PTS transporter subunit EIIC [Paenibacillus pinistramenti]
MANTFVDKLERYLQPISNKISTQKDLNAISAGLTRFLPVTIIGSIFYLIANFPVTSWINFLKDINIYNALMVPYNVTFGLLSIYTVFFIAYSFAQKANLDALSVSFVALISFFVLTPFVTDDSGALSYHFDYLGSGGLFVSILIAILVSRAYQFIVKRNWVIKMPDGVPPFVEKSFSSLIPAVLITLVSAVISYLFTLTSYGNVHALVVQLLQKPLLGMGSSFWAFLVAYMVMQMLWWFGIHGFNVVGAVMLPIWLGLDTQRLAQIQAGEHVTNYVGMVFMDSLGTPALSIALTFLWMAKSKQLKSVSRIALPAAIFNIAEPVNFGIPTVLNAILFIPVVILIPLVTNLTLYFFMATGIIPILTGVQVPHQVPMVLFGLVQGNWQLAIWQLLMIPVSMALFYPFAKVYDKSLLKQAEQEEAKEQAKMQEGFGKVSM